MNKTKLGISVGMMAAALYFMGLFGGYIPIVILCGYVLMFEDNDWLKRMAVKTVTVMIVFSLLITVFNLIPSAISFIGSIVAIFGKSFYLGILTNLIDAVVTLLSIIEKITLLILGINAKEQKNVYVPVVDDLINKYIN